MSRLIRLTIAIIVGLSATLLPFTALADTVGVTYDPSPLVIAKGDTSKHIVKVSLENAPSGNVTLTLNYPKDLVTPGKTQVKFTPKDYTNIELGITLTNKGASSSDLSSGVLAVSLFGKSANGTTSYTGTLSITSQGNPNGGGSSGTGGAGIGCQHVASCSLVELLADPTGFVYISWQVTRSIINIILILALLLISFSNILKINIDTYTVKRALPNLVIGVILANASFLIVKYMADLANVGTYLFVNLSGFTKFTDFIAQTLSQLGVVALNTVGGGIGLVVTLGGVLLPVIILIFAIIAIILVLWLAFLLYFRLVAIYLLTILAPLAFVAYGIPGFEKYFKMWWQQFVKWMFMLVAMSAIFWLMIVISKSVNNNNNIASLLIMYVLFTTALTLPSKWGGAVIQKADQFFRNNPLSKGAVNYAGTKGQQIWYRMPGVARVAALKELNAANAKKDIEQLKKRGMNKILAGQGVAGFGKKAGLNQAKLNALDQEINANEAQYKAQQEQAADQLFNLSERVNAAEFRKRLAEEKKNAHVNEKKLEFMIKHDKGLMADVAKAIIDQEVLSQEVGRQEGMIKGNAAGEYLQPLQAAQNWKRLSDEYESIKDSTDEKDIQKKEILQKQMGQVQGAFDKLMDQKNEKGEFIYKDFRGKEYIDRLRNDFNALSDADKSGDKGKALQAMIAEAQKSDHITIEALTHEMKKSEGQGRIWQGRQRQTAKMFNAGIAGQIEADIKEQTVEEIQREMTAFFKEKLKGDEELIQDFLNGDTAKMVASGKVSASDIRDGLVVSEKYKTILKSTNDIRHGDALVSFMEVAQKHNNNQFNVETINKVLGTNFANTEDGMKQASSAIRRAGQQQRRQLAGLVAQQSGALSRQANVRIENAFLQPESKPATAVPPPPKPEDYYSAADIERAGGAETLRAMGENPVSFEEAQEAWQQQYGQAVPSGTSATQSPPAPTQNEPTTPAPNSSGENLTPEEDEEIDEET